MMGFVVGFGAGFVARDVYPYVREVARPAAKGIMKGTILSFEKMREGLFRFGEVLEDLTAEVKSELMAEHPAKIRKTAKRAAKRGRRTPEELARVSAMVEGERAETRSA
jgi:hypothetical protein